MLHNLEYRLGKMSGTVQFCAVTVYKLREKTCSTDANADTYPRNHKCWTSTFPALRTWNTSAVQMSELTFELTECWKNISRMRYTTKDTLLEFQVILSLSTTYLSETSCKNKWVEGGTDCSETRCQ